MEFINLIKCLNEQNIGIALDGADVVLSYDGESIPDDVLDALKEHKQLLVKFLSRPALLIPISKKNGSSYLLSSSQRRLWVLSQLGSGNVAYNIPGFYLMEGELSVSGLRHSFTELIGRHEILRTVFKETESGEIRQEILDGEDLGFEIREVDLRGSAEGAIGELLSEEYIEPFDLSRGPLLRATLYQVEERRWIFAYTMHHIISDGWSMGVVIRELLLFYNGYVSGVKAELPALRIQYKDYAEWEQAELGGAGFEVHRQYWLDQFSGELPVLDLLGDRPRPGIKSYNGGSVSSHYKKETLSGLKALSQSGGGTLYMSLLSAVNILLYRYTGQQDIIIGSPIAGREHADLADQIGFYVNTLALRSRFRGEDSYRQVQEKVRAVTLGAYEHQVYPFDALVEELDLSRDMSRNALFDVMVSLQNNAVNELVGVEGYAGLKVSGYSAGDNPTSKFDLLFNFYEQDEGLGVMLEYNSDVYDRITAERMLDHLRGLLESILQSPDTAVQDLDYMSEQERRQVLQEFNATDVPYGGEKTVISLFEEQAAASPDATAVVFGDRELSYRELNERSNELAHYLRREGGVRPGDNVGVLLERSERMIIALLGILKSGAAYVPVDPSYPQTRIEYIRQDSNCKFVVDAAIMEAFWELSGKYKKSNPVRVGKPSDVAYVIYTSGSTGVPKGVMIPHTAIVNIINHYSNELMSISSLTCNYVFDVSVLEIFVSLLNGGKLLIPEKEVVYNSWEYADFIYKNKVTHCYIHPFQLKDISTWICSQPTIYLKAVLIGVEPIKSADTALLLKNDVKIVNGYGPSECCICSSMFYLNSSGHDRTILPIGRPITNTRIYILDERGSLCPVGVRGEICIGGDGLALGYINQGVLTEEKFVPDPYRAGERMYRSGDMGRWLADGNIEYLGRGDEQVKVRGYRIEPGEIESVLNSHPAIDLSVILTQESAAGDKELIAYVISNKSVNAPELRTYLAERLPDYMIPANYISIERLPMTVNGKADKRRLRLTKASELESGSEYIAPRNEIEARLAEVWQEILGKERISIRDNFFDLGGHSLKALRLKYVMANRYGFNLNIRDIFNKPTIEQMALPTDCESGLIRLNAGTFAADTNIYFVPPIFGNPFIYKPLAKKLQNNCNCYGLQYAGQNADEHFYTSIEQIAQSFCEQIVENEHGRDVLLFGYSMGAAIAFEMNKILQSKSIKVRLILVDRQVADRIGFDLQHKDKQVEWLMKQYKRMIPDELINEDVLSRFITNNLNILNEYRQTGKVDNDIILFEAESKNKGHMKKWARYTSGSIDYRYIKGSHWDALADVNHPEFISAIEAVIGDFQLQGEAEKERIILTNNSN